MKIYLAGPISGKGYAEVVSIYKGKIDLLTSYGYDVLCPMTGKAHLKNEVNFVESGYTYPTSTNHAIFERDNWMISQSDVVLADLSNSGDRVSIGTMMELAWASAYRKHTVVVMQSDNVHRHAFVLESADIVFINLEDAFAYLFHLAKGI